MKKVITKLIACMLFVVSFISISGCNTVQGFGEDVQKGGQEIEKAAS